MSKRGRINREFMEMLNKQHHTAEDVLECESHTSTGSKK
jgi:hypothetical protein